jgi:chaperonin cofactor prefoldin
MLSAELSKARDQLSQIHEQNVKLMHQIRDSNSRIQELEDLLNKKPPPP